MSSVGGSRPTPSWRSPRRRLIALLVVGLIAGTAFAGKGGQAGGGGPSSGGGTLELRMLNDANGNGAPNHMDTVTFDVSTTATSMPMVGLRCWQGANFVHDGYIALYDASWLKKYFLLGGTSWDPALSAGCTARLFYYDRRGREKFLGAYEFSVAP